MFSCTILDMDILYAVYNVPTIGICRAEQREKVKGQGGEGVSGPASF